MKWLKPNGLALALGILALFLGGLLHLAAIASSEDKSFSTFDQGLFVFGIVALIYVAGAYGYMLIRKGR